VTDLVSTKRESNILQDAVLSSYVLHGAHTQSFSQ